MYFIDATDPFAGTSDDKAGSLSFPKQIAEAYNDAFSLKRIEKFFLKLEEDAKTLNTNIGNGLTSNLKNIQDTIYEVYEEGLQYGFSFADAKDYMSEIGTVSKRMASFTKESTKQAILLGKAMGASAKEMATLNANLMQMGYGQKAANDLMEKTFNTARKYGVDASVLTKTVSDNIFKAQAYGFKDGVKGLTDMAVQAQRVGTNMELAEKAASKAFDPDSAIEMASNLQLLGGAASSLGDPFQLLYMAQSDMGALQEKIFETSASMVDFNQKTGEFSISPAMRRDMTDYAKAINSSYDEVAKNAIKFRREQEIASRIPLSAGFSEEEQSIIKAMGEIGPGGEIQVRLPGSDQMVDISKLTASDMQELKNELVTNSKSTEEIAKDQLSVLQKQAITLTEIKNAGIFGTGPDKGKDIVSSAEKLTDPAEYTNLIAKIQDEMSKFDYDDVYDAITNSMKNTITKLTSTVNKMVGAINNFVTVISNKTFTGDTENKNTNQIEDFLIPSESDTMITTNFGGLIKQMFPDKGDSILGMPENDMDELFYMANLGYESINNKKLFPIPNEQNLDYENNLKLSEYVVEQKIISENKQESNINIGGKSELDINIKSDIPVDLLSKIIDNEELKEKIMTTINERLSKEYTEKLINPITG